MDGYLGSAEYAAMVAEFGDPVREQLQSGLWQVRTSSLDYHYENAGGERVDVKGRRMTVDLDGICVHVQASAGSPRMCEVCADQFQPFRREQRVCSRTCEAKL